MSEIIKQAKAIFIQRYAIAEEWKNRNPVLYPGEIGIESDTGKIKVGREISMPWNSIDYVNSTAGTAGNDGRSIFVRYSFSPDGTNYTEEWSLGQNYLGIAVAHEAPNDKAEYEWSLFASNIGEPIAITLSADGWEDNLQTVSVPGIGSNSGVFATAHPDNLEPYIQDGIFLEEASLGKATFSCAIVPTVDIKVNIIIIEPVVGGSSGSVETIIVDTAEDLPATATDGSMAVILEFSGGNNDPSEGGIVPRPTASDNGKFLQVVDGKYALVTLRDVSKEGM